MYTPPYQYNILREQFIRTIKYKPTATIPLPPYQLGERKHGDASTWTSSTRGRAASAVAVGATSTSTTSGGPLGVCQQPSSLSPPPAYELVVEQKHA